MTNAELFKQIFNGLTATELWSMSESKFLEWLNTDYADKVDFVPNSKWLELYNNPVYTVFCCSNCNGIGTRAFRFCPTCGSRMENTTNTQEDDEHTMFDDCFPCTNCMRYDCDECEYNHWRYEQ